MKTEAAKCNLCGEISDNYDRWRWFYIGVEYGLTITQDDEKASVHICENCWDNLTKIHLQEQNKARRVEEAKL